MKLVLVLVNDVRGGGARDGSVVNGGTVAPRCSLFEHDR